MRVVVLVILLAACAAEQPQHRHHVPTAAQLADARQRVAEGRRWLVWSQGAADPGAAISDARAGLTALGVEYRNAGRALKDDTVFPLGEAEEREARGDDAGAAAVLQRVLRERIALYVELFQLE